MVEAELLPILRQNNCSFVAYNPLAAGLLTGKHSKDGDVKESRFKNNESNPFPTTLLPLLTPPSHPPTDPNYLPRFYTDSNFEAVETIRAACATVSPQLTMIEATYRWMCCNSALLETDGVLIGASSLEQLECNLAATDAAMEHSSLPPSVLQAFEKAYEITSKTEANHSLFPYWRSFSADMPGRESLDPGAAYTAAYHKEKCNDAAEKRGETDRPGVRDSNN